LFKIKVFSFITFLNLYIKKITSLKKNKEFSRIYDWFMGKGYQYKKKGMRRGRYVIPRVKVFYDYLSSIKGLNDEFLIGKHRFGEVINTRRRNLKKLNVPWAGFFNTGFFMPYSYKRFIRKIFFNLEKKTNEVFLNKKDKILTTFFFVKFLLFDKPQIANYSKITVNSFFFNRKKVVSRLLNMKRILGLNEFFKKRVPPKR